MKNLLVLSILSLFLFSCEKNEQPESEWLNRGGVADENGIYPDEASGPGLNLFTDESDSPVKWELIESRVYVVERGTSTTLDVSSGYYWDLSEGAHSLRVFEDAYYDVETVEVGITTWEFRIVSAENRRFEFYLNGNYDDKYMLDYPSNNFISINDHWNTANDTLITTKLGNSKLALGIQIYDLENKEIEVKMCEMTMIDDYGITRNMFGWLRFRQVTL